MWNTYSTWYLNQAIHLSDYETGLVVMVGQLIDAIAQPLIGYCSDNIDTRFGKRMPWYIVGHLCTLPCFYMVFNPPDSVVDSKHSLIYFLIVPSIMNIGQGSVQLSHMSIVNSITYDQQRRDLMINYRNSCSYFAGIFLPVTSFFMFKYVDAQMDKFAYIANICTVMGMTASFYFMLVINEPRLVNESKRIFDSFFLIQADDIGSDGFIFDIEEETMTESDKGSQRDKDDDLQQVFGVAPSPLAEVKISQDEQQNFFDMSNNNISEFFNEAKNNM